MNIIKSISTFLDIIKTTFNELTDDKVFPIAAALSFYSLISLAPILLIISFLIGSIFGKDAAEGQIFTEISDDIGPGAAEFVQSLIVNSSLPDTGLLSLIISSLVFLWAALLVFVHIRNSLNFIWGVEIKPGSSLKEFFTGRLFSIFLMFLIGLLFVLSMIVGMLLKLIKEYIHQSAGGLLPNLQLTEHATTIITITVLFMLMYKYLPSVKIEFRFVIAGAVVTSILFYIGKILIGIYLSNSKYSSVYGAAGSLVILLFWIYYSSLIFFFGAELIQVIRKRYSSEPLYVKKNAIKVMTVTEQIKKSMSEQ